MIVIVDIGPNLVAVFSGAGFLIGVALFIWAFFKGPGS